MFFFSEQLNPNRSNFRRPPSNIQLINQPFNAEGFNFNKVKEEEKLFNLKHEDDTVESMIYDLNLLILI